MDFSLCNCSLKGHLLNDVDRWKRHKFMVIVILLDLKFLVGIEILIKANHFALVEDKIKALHGAFAFVDADDL